MPQEIETRIEDVAGLLVDLLRVFEAMVEIGERSGALAAGGDDDAGALHVVVGDGHGRTFGRSL
ncbi:MAG TPA: hypothetical protein PK264_01875 [Hyphomicrobiaceae bacterium]|nr:hypothetical protein [Hyphomicrobiaceae bacterium]